MTEATASSPYRVLFLCTHNSSRSQMAEGLLRARGGTRYQVFSAGTHPHAVHPLAIRAMAELGIDISEGAGHRAKGIEAFNDAPPMDLVVTVCDEAAEECALPHGKSCVVRFNLLFSSDSALVCPPRLQGHSSAL